MSMLGVTHRDAGVDVPAEVDDASASLPFFFGMGCLPLDDAADPLIDDVANPVPDDAADI